MKRIHALLWLCLAIVTGASMFEISYRARALEEELASLNKQALAHEEAIHVLKGEWAYLNQPARLSRLARTHLGLVPGTGEHLTEMSALPMRGVAPKDDTPAHASENPLLAQAQTR